MKRLLLLLISGLYHLPCLFSQAPDDLKPSTNPSESYVVHNTNLINFYTVARQLSPNLNTPVFKVGFYLSTDSIITTSDYLIGTHQVNCMTANPPCAGISIGSEVHMNCSTGSLDLDLTSVPAGTYFAGTYIDYEDSVTENNENDNAWTYRNSNGQLTSIVYPGPISGIRLNDTKSKITKKIDVEGHYRFMSDTHEPLLLFLYTLEGKLLYSEQNLIIAVPAMHKGLFVIIIMSNSEYLVEKISYR
jgi:hypothetical protein